jgi:hypothetical protein
MAASVGAAILAAILLASQRCSKYSGGDVSVPLALNYSVDHERLMRQRAATGYGFRHSSNGIDRRSGLSLQEFFDVYDAKW